MGPANAGKVALLLERYLDVLEREPVLIVPNRSDVDRVERDLLARRPALLSGSIGTFDDAGERFPDLVQFWRASVQKVRGRASVVARGGNRLRDFVSQ